MQGNKTGENLKPQRLRGLKADFYRDETVLAQEHSLLFLKSWQFLCHASDLAKTGDFKSFSLFGQNIFLIKDGKQQIRGFYNVCPHRGHQLLEGQGHKNRLTCPYHAWSFSPEGQLLAARGKQFNEAIEQASICLFPVKVDSLLDFIFVNFDETAPPLADFAPGLEAQILTACPHVPDMVLHAESADFGHTYECASNWKVMLDNYLECYHCQGAHPDFNDMMDISASKFTIYKNYTHQVAPTAFKAKNRAFPLNLEHDILVGNFWFLFPNTTLGQFPGVKGFYVSRFDPINPGLTQRTSCVLEAAEPTDPDAPRRDQLRTQWTTNVVAREDQSLCENVQKGLQQKAFKQGWYVSHPHDHGISEHAMRYFHDLYLEAMRPKA